ncbi:MAG: glycoside hydrolase family 5 protein [bacterium]|nr:glycoside hydrolase family 5 protein [bacterium]
MTRLAVASTTLAALLGCAHVGGTGATSALTEPHRALRMMPVPQGTGVNIHFYSGNENDLRMIADSGLGIVRMDVGWGGAEKEPGVYDFSHYDKLLTDLDARNIRLLFIIDYGNPLYDGGLSPHTDEGRAAYARFCSALAGHFAGRNVIWELWNEPNIQFWKPKPNVDDYMAWCHTVVPAIRAADPDACIIGPASCGFPFRFFEDCFKQGMLELIDGVSVHPYRNYMMGPETAVLGYRRLERLIAEYRPGNKNLPILSGEWGYSTTEIAREQQGKFLPRQWLCNMANGIPISIWYDWHDDGRDPKEREHNFGTVTWDYKPKPAYTAMKALIAELDGYMPGERLGLGGDYDYVVAFTRDDCLKLAVWTTADPHTIDLGSGIVIERSVGHLGQELPSPTGATVELNDAPKYLTLRTPAPARLWMPRFQIAAPGLVVPGSAGNVKLSVVQHNPTDKTATLELKPVDAEGAWTTPTTLTIPPGGTKTARWRGTLNRCDAATLPLAIEATLTMDGETSRTVCEPIELTISKPVALAVAWRHDGMQVTVSNCETLPPDASIAVVQDGNALCTYSPGRSEGLLKRLFGDITLSDGPRNVGVRIIDGQGRVLAEKEPMTYALVDAVKAPIGDDATAHYRLWHEGDDDRKPDLSGTIRLAPGDDAPFKRAVRVDYRIEPNWCFWQWGPKESIPLPCEKPKRIMIWVYTKTGGDLVRNRIADTTAQTFQVSAGELTGAGWQLMELALDGPMSSWGGAGDNEVHWPVCWISYYLQDPVRKEVAGTTYLTGVVVAW